jgi:outer membrane protein assembly factor BamB
MAIVQTRVLTAVGKDCRAIPNHNFDAGQTVGGVLWAWDAKTGKSLWSFQNPHGDLIEGPPMTYMYKGKQYVAEYMECPVGSGTQGKYQLCDNHDHVVVLGL